MNSYNNFVETLLNLGRWSVNSYYIKYGCNYLTMSSVNLDLTDFLSVLR